MTVLMSVRMAAGWVNAQMKLFQVKSPALFEERQSGGADRRIDEADREQEDRGEQEQRRGASSPGRAWAPCR